jgi:hypothetical protein
MRKVVFFDNAGVYTIYLKLMAKAETGKVETQYVWRVPPAPPSSFLHGVYVARTARRTPSLLD